MSAQVTGSRSASKGRAIRAFLGPARAPLRGSRAGRHTTTLCLLGVRCAAPRNSGQTGPGASARPARAPLRSGARDADRGLQKRCRPNRPSAAQRRDRGSDSERPANREAAGNRHGGGAQARSLWRASRAQPGGAGATDREAPEGPGRGAPARQGGPEPGRRRPDASQGVSAEDDGAGMDAGAGARKAARASVFAGAPPRGPIPRGAPSNQNKKGKEPMPYGRGLARAMDGARSCAMDGAPGLFASDLACNARRDARAQSRRLSPRDGRPAWMRAMRK